MSARQRDLWQNSRFQRLFTARLISNIGNGMMPIALAFGVLDIPGADATTLSIVLAAQALPIVFTLPFGGAIADRLGAARVIGTTDMLLSIVILTMAGLFITETVTVPVLVGLAALTGVAHGLWYPAFIGLVPAVVEERHLQGANGAVAMASNGGIIAGNAIGGVLVTFVGSGWAIAVDALTFFVAGILVFSFRSVSQRNESGESMLGDIVHGWRVFWSFKWVVAVVASFSVVVMAERGATEVMGPVLAKTFYDGPSSWAWVLGGVSFGMLTGAILGARIRVRRPMVVGMVLSFALPIWLVTLAFVPPLPFVVITAFGWGLGIELFMVLWYTALQTNVPREALSRVSSYDAMGSLMLGPVGLALSGPLIGVVGLHTGFLIAAGVSAVALTLGLTSKSLRGLRSGLATTAGTTT